MLNLAYADTMTAAAFVAHFATYAGLSIWIALVLGALFGAVFSAALNRLIFTPYIRRGTGLFGMVILTVAVGIVIQFSLAAVLGTGYFNLRMATGSSYHVAFMVFTTSQIAIIVIAVVAMAAIQLVLTFTKLGKAMRATAVNPRLARDCGINTNRVIDAVWLISGALCGLAGVVLAMNVTTFSTSTEYAYLIPIVAVAVLGGVGSASGAMLGALVIGISTEVVGALFSPGYKVAIAYAALLIVLLVRPQGIFAEASAEKELAA
jgi:branched-subunit amino acid ABC-type transport system permease component